ncbi:hypothetical protein FPRO04_04866 [Fusarium proliferatum]|nr:hypothetical protein FPRO04_04866 [Fusarium proliferatum]
MSDNNSVVPSDEAASGTSSMIAETGKSDINETSSTTPTNESSSTPPTNEGELNTTPQPTATIPPAPRVIKTERYYFDNPHEDYLVRNVMAHSNLALQAIVFQGERAAGNCIARKLPSFYPGRAVREFHFNLPFRVANTAALRQLKLPLGFRRCFLGLKPKGTVVHKLARDVECPPKLVKRYNRIFEAWKNKNGALPENQCDVALMAWPRMAYCEGGMSLEFVQELEADSLGGTDVVQY